MNSIFALRIFFKPTRSSFSRWCFLASTAPDLSTHIRIVVDSCYVDARFATRDTPPRDRQAPRQQSTHRIDTFVVSLVDGYVAQCSSPTVRRAHRDSSIEREPSMTVGLLHRATTAPSLSTHQSEYPSHSDKAFDSFGHAFRSPRRHSALKTDSHSTQRATRFT